MIIQWLACGTALPRTISTIVGTFGTGEESTKFLKRVKAAAA